MKRLARHAENTPLAFLTSGALLAVFLSTVLGAVTGLIAYVVVPGNPTATATILLNTLEGNAFRPGGSGEDLINLTTEAEVVRSDAMAQQVSDALEWSPEPTDLVKNVSVTIPTNTQILSITFTDVSPTRAETGAQTYADTYLDYRRQRAVESIGDKRALIEGQAEVLQSEFDTLAAELAVTPAGSSDATRINARLQTLTTQLAQLNAQLADLSATTLNAGQVVVRATVDPRGPLSHPLTFAAIGAGFGTTASLASAFLLSRRARAIRGTREIRLVGQIPLAALDHVPGESPWTEDVPSEFVAVRQSVLSALAGQAKRTVMVSATWPGSTTTTVALARSMAQAGLNTALVDTTGRLVAPTSRTGETTTLARLLAARGKLTPVLARGTDGVRLLTSGRELDLTALAIRGEALEESLHRLLADFDVVLLHVDRVTTDLGRTLASASKHVVLEVRSEVTRTTDLLSAAQACEQSGAIVVGVVLVERDRPIGGSAEGDDDAVEARPLDDTQITPTTPDVKMEWPSVQNPESGSDDPGPIAHARWTR